MIYPIGIRNFEKIRTDGYVYIDKTALIYQLATTGCYYFLSRPRRFGKSLLISTMDAYFSGKRELFKGLAIDKLDNKWTTYPVLRLDLNTAKYDSKEALEHVLDDALKIWEETYGTSSTEVTPELRFKGIVEHAAKKAALQQIEDKGYAKPFAQDSRTLYKIGINFSSDTRDITEWKIANNK